MLVKQGYNLYFYKNDKPEDNPETTEKMLRGSITEILSDTSLWQADLSDMTDKVMEYYEIIDKSGAKETMKWILSE